MSHFPYLSITWRILLLLCWPTYCQQPDVESLPDGGLSAVSQLWIFHLHAQQISLHPLFPRLLIISCFFLSLYFFTEVCLSPPNVFCFSPWCSGFISLFTGGETNPPHSAGTEAVVNISDKQRLRCASVWMCVFAHTSTLNSWSLKKRNFTEKNPNLAAFHHAHTHAGKLAMTPSTLCPFTFGRCVNDEHLEVLLTSDLPMFTLLMGGERGHGREGVNQLF